MLYFHGTNEKAAKQITESGFNIDSPRQSDPGDFGWGIYLTTHYARARSYGIVVLAVELIKTVNLAIIQNPYFTSGINPVLPISLEEHLFYDLAFDEKGNMLNVSQNTTTEEKILISKQIKDAFLKADYDGILAGPFNPRRTDKELVVFNTNIIESIYTAKVEK